MPNSFLYNLARNEQPRFVPAKLVSPLRFRSCSSDLYRGAQVHKILGGDAASEARQEGVDEFLKTLSDAVPLPRFAQPEI